jgi:outer membrane protein
MITKLSVVALLATVSLTWAELKVGIINSEKIFLEYEGTKQAQEKFNKEVAKWEQEATDRQKEIKELQQQLEKQSLLLSAERKKEIEEKLQQKVIEYRKFLNEKFGQQGEALKQNQELTAPIIDRIKAILDKIGEAESYDLILDTQNGGVVFWKKTYDLTDKVLKELQKEK